MNKVHKILGIVAVLVAVVAFAGVASAFAQGPNQPADVTHQGRTQVQDNANAGMGLMAVDEVTMHATIAEALDMSVADFDAAIAAGKTPFILAQERGIDFAEVQAAMNAVHARCFAASCRRWPAHARASQLDAQPTRRPKRPR